MSQNQVNLIDKKTVQQSLQANQHNCLTSFYYLLYKKLKIQGDLED